jgi:NAD(P)H dehydrogenase (quinone)
MRHAIILAHPGATSFAGAVAAAYQDAVEAHGHSCVLRDLYRIDFDPRLKASERPDGEYQLSDDVRDERELLGDCDVFVFVYPIWFGTPPAILKGYVDRVFSQGFGFEAFRAGRARPLLEGKRLLSFTSSGSTLAWLEESGVWMSLRALFDDYVAKVCGLTVYDHVHFPSIVPGLDERWVRENLEKVRQTAKALAAAPAPGGR